MKNKMIMIGNVLAYIVLYFLIFTIVGKVWYGVLINSSVVGDWVANNPLGSIILNDVVALPIFALLVLLIKKRSILKISKFRKISLKHILLSIIIGLAMGVFLINSFSLPVCKNIPVFDQILEYIYGSNLLAFAGFVIVGTFFKEILFRGLIFNELKKEMNIVVAVLVHALIYGGLFFFFNVPLTLFSILGTVVVVMTYLLTGSIWAAYLAQAFNNISAYYIKQVNPDMFEGNNVLPIVISMLVIGTCLYLMYKFKTDTSISESKEQLNEAC